MENKDLEKDLDYEGWTKYITTVYDSYRQMEEKIEKEKQTKNAVLSKETFLETLNQIKTHRVLSLKLSDTLEQLTEDCRCDALIYSRYENLVVKILSEIFKTDLISYFIYELDFGKNWCRDCSSDFEEVTALFSAERLYDFLIKKYKDLKN